MWSWGAGWWRARRQTRTAAGPSRGWRSLGVYAVGAAAALLRREGCPTTIGNLQGLQQSKFSTRVRLILRLYHTVWSNSSTLSSSFSPLSLIKTFSSSWLMPSMLLGTLEMEGFGTVILDNGIWADFDMENCCKHEHTCRGLKWNVFSSWTCEYLIYV